MIEKKIPLYLPIMMILIVVLLCRNDLKSKDAEITEYILKNQNILTQMAVTALDSGSDSVQLIDGVHDISFWSGNDAVVEFTYYSVGFGSASGMHYGFYYSPKDVPTAYGDQEITLIAAENGWTWTGEDNSYGFTKKIMDHWYYYEAAY